MPKLRGEDIADLRVPAIGPNEQYDLAQCEAEFSANEERASLLLNHSIGQLREYKQSLITAAVTGEFDVTTATTKIPEF